MKIEHITHTTHEPRPDKNVVESYMRPRSLIRSFSLNEAQNEIDLSADNAAPCQSTRMRNHFPHVRGPAFLIPHLYR